MDVLLEPFHSLSCHLFELVKWSEFLLRVGLLHTSLEDILGLFPFFEMLFEIWNGSEFIRESEVEGLVNYLRHRINAEMEFMSLISHAWAWHLLDFKYFLKKNAEPWVLIIDMEIRHNLGNIYFEQFLSRHNGGVDSVLVETRLHGGMKWSIDCFAGFYTSLTA